ncbi:amidohydrolase [Microbacterium paraoxydans]|uniref:amidohydrolase n=1 Tax=Microbacterium paraoxydans TaxID=199592 RepID=UPI0021A76546|nr:amidohydrolase [Microbacterium paraoxydans]MCT2224946.1 amidohydrolase [Microbacterium paraoxydans]
MTDTATVYRNATVFDGLADAPVQSAFAVRGDRILAVGTETEVRSAAGEGAAVVDLGGAFVMPGVIEAHAHLAMFGHAQGKVQLRDCTSVAQIQQRLLEARAMNPDATVVEGVSWLFDALPAGVTQPTAAMIDEVIDDIPVFLDANDLHSTWVNTAALRAAGIDRDTVDPIGGQVVRDEDGEATGFLLETAAMDLLADYLDGIRTEEEVDGHLELAFGAYLAAGVTGAADMGMTEQSMAALRRRLDRDGRLPFPVTAHWWLSSTGDPAADLAQVERAVQLRDELEATGTPWLKVVGVKFILDGVIDACTAAMVRPYADGSNADPIWSREAATPVAIAADRAGLQLAMHAIGDAASALAVDLVEACERANSTDIARRPRIEHLESVAPETVARMRAHGIAASMQPVHCDPAILDNWMAMLGDQRAEDGFPWNWFRDVDVPVALGTDAPTAPHEALHNLFIAMTGRSSIDRALPPYHPERAFTAAQALAAATSGAAHVGAIDDAYGRIAPGFFANVAVLDIDPLSAPTDDLLTGAVLLTLVHGEVAYRRP